MPAAVGTESRHQAPARGGGHDEEGLGLVAEGPLPLPGAMLTRIKTPRLQHPESPAADAVPTTKPAGRPGGFAGMLG